MAEATIDQQFIEYIVKTLVGNPDKVRIERTIDERGVLLELYVDSEDLGRVIGRNGATAKSIRTLLRALGVKNDARYNLKIVDTNGGPRPVRPDDQPAESTPSSDSPMTDTSDSPVDAPQADDAPQDSTVHSTGAADAPVTPVTEPADEPQPEPESDVDRHRKEIEDIAGGLDI